MQTSLVIMFSSFWFGSPEIQSDEVVVLFPTYANQEVERPGWHARIHGSVFEPEENSRRRTALIGTLRRTLRIKQGTAAADLLKQRVAYFLVDNERGKVISVRLGTKQRAQATSAANGHFRASLKLASEDVKSLLGNQPPNQVAWARFDVAASDGRKFLGKVQFIAHRGLSVISDIDDTIKETQVTQRREMLANTFTRPFRPVEGISQLYQHASRQGAAFHYVSGSPWQLYQPLEAFRAQEGFPEGSFHLKNFRMKDSSLFDLFASHEATKTKAITEILAAFPARRFLLVGDSGEEDPEIYGKLARQYGDQIVGIFIRNVSDESATDERFQKAFGDVQRDRWHLFSKADEIQAAFFRGVEQHAADSQSDFDGIPSDRHED